MKVAIRTWGLGLAALSMVGLALSGAMADGPAPGGPAGGAPGVVAGPGGAIDAALEAVGAIDAGPVAGGIPVDGAIPVDGPAAGPIDGVAPPPGPALVHHFVNVVRFPGYRRQIFEHRTELLLYADNSFEMLLPNDRFCGPGGCAPAADGPVKIVGTWVLNADELLMTFDDGFVDVAWMTVANNAPALRFHGRRWADILAAPAVVPAGGPAVAGPVAGAAIPQ